MHRLTFAMWTAGRSTPALLALAFATLYFAIGPGRFFSVDEVLVEAMARAAYSRHNLEVPAMNTAVLGREGAYYAGHRGPALGYAAMPLVALGDILDNRFGSFNGGIAAGPALGTTEHPLRWGGRISTFIVLAANAIFAGLAVSMLYLISRSMGGTHRVALLVASVAGTSTLLASEATHFFQHPLEALMLLTGFWFVVSPRQRPLRQRPWIGGLALGLAVLARPSAAPAAVVIWFFGVAKAWKETNPDNPRQLVRFVPRALVAPSACAALYLLHNYRQFGNALQFGARERAFEVSFEALKAVAAYLVSPGLSVFLFAVPLALMPFCLKEAIHRWPLETRCILFSSLAHSMVIVFFRWWDGSVSYGPRYMLVPILLLMPLTVPAFEQAVCHRFTRWRVAISLSLILGLMVQVIGVAVYVVVNEWYQDQHNISANGAFVFIPAASPIWIQLQELLAGRNLTMWGVRAVLERSMPLILLIIALLSISALSYWMVLKSHGSESSRIPAVFTIGIAVLVLVGFLSTAPIAIPSDMRVLDLVNAGLEAQKVGLVVKAQELYAVVLGLDPSNKYALYNLALLYEGAGKAAEAESLYERVLASDPKFAPAVYNLARYRVRQDETPQAECQFGPDCYRLGQDFLNSGELAGALRLWETASQRFPTEHWLIRNVGWCRYQLGDYTGAIEAYTRAVDLSPSDIGIRTDLAWSLLRAARYDDARKICNEVLLEDGDNDAANAILAQLPAW